MGSDWIETENGETTLMKMSLDNRRNNEIKENKTRSRSSIPIQKTKKKKYSVGDTSVTTMDQRRSPKLLP